MIQSLKNFGGGVDYN